MLWTAVLLFVAAAIAFVFLVWGGAEIHVAATLLSPGLGTPVDATIVGISVIVGIYATLGGFRAVVATDKLQYGIVGLYIVAIGWLAVRGMLVEPNVSLDQVTGFFPAADVLALKSERSWTYLLGPGIATIVLTFIA